MSGASVIVAGTLAVPGRSPSFCPRATRDGVGSSNFTLTGTWVGSVNLERSFNNGSTWSVASVDSVGTPATFTSNLTVEFTEGERGVVYSVNATSVASGTVGYRLSQ